MLPKLFRPCGHGLAALFLPFVASSHWARALMGPPAR